MQDPGSPPKGTPSAEPSSLARELAKRDETIRELRQQLALRDEELERTKHELELKMRNTLALQRSRYETEIKEIREGRRARVGLLRPRAP